MKITIEADIKHDSDEDIQFIKDIGNVSEIKGFIRALESSIVGKQSEDFRKKYYDLKHGWIE